MGLVGLLVATIIIILLVVFGKSALSSFNSAPHDSPKTVINKAQDAANSTNENSKVQQNQIKNIESP